MKYNNIIILIFLIPLFCGCTNTPSDKYTENKTEEYNPEKFEIKRVAISGDGNTYSTVEEDINGNIITNINSTIIKTDSKNNVISNRISSLVISDNGKTVGYFVEQRIQIYDQLYEDHKKSKKEPITVKMIDSGYRDFAFAVINGVKQKEYFCSGGFCIDDLRISPNGERYAFNVITEGCIVTDEKEYCGRTNESEYGYDSIGTNIIHLDDDLIVFEGNKDDGKELVVNGEIIDKSYFWHEFWSTGASKNNWIYTFPEENEIYLYANNIKVPTGVETLGDSFLSISPNKKHIVLFGKTKNSKDHINYSLIYVDIENNKIKKEEEVKIYTIMDKLIITDDGDFAAIVFEQDHTDIIFNGWRKGYSELGYHIPSKEVYVNKNKLVFVHQLDNGNYTLVNEDISPYDGINIKELEKNQYEEISEINIYENGKIAFKAKKAEDKYVVVYDGNESDEYYRIYFFEVKNDAVIFHAMNKTTEKYFLVINNKKEEEHNRINDIAISKNGKKLIYAYLDDNKKSHLKFIEN